MGGMVGVCGWWWVAFSFIDLIKTCTIFAWIIVFLASASSEIVNQQIATFWDWELCQFRTLKFEKLFSNVPFIFPHYHSLSVCPNKRGLFGTTILSWYKESHVISNKTSQQNTITLPSNLIKSVLCLHKGRNCVIVGKNKFFVFVQLGLGLSWTLK